ncbi:pentatricopeptide repeat-containing protein At3g47530-like [Impatiens glandulifera]|uniref:pentatricopeptide repeat-containing protein At3g47530-like n=1 Tax=Impatiens glandulifera TaxID=253017 RepID=UPI001FB128C3|nr:pentatricopeptide repeat-containing protein At3g47530-like [Impatiens glandulifera]
MASRLDTFFLSRIESQRRIGVSSDCNTIEVNRKVYEFIAEDISHYRKTEVYRMVEEVGQQLRIAGYDGDGLDLHSEKLAIVFGFLSTNPGLTIRVAKNLDVCSFKPTFTFIYVNWDFNLWDISGMIQ